MSCIICSGSKERKRFRYQGTDFYECETCGLVRTLPFPSEDDIEAHYRRKFQQGNYSTLLDNMPDYLDVYRTYVDLLKESVGPLTGKRVLDVGCFTADFLDLMKEEGALTYGIELQEEAFEIARVKHPGRIFNCRFERASFEQPFDIITLFGIIEHVVNPEELIHMASTLLADGGTLAVQTPDTGSVFARVMGRRWPPFAPVEHIHYFSRTNLTLLLHRYRFGKVRARAHVKRLTLNYICAMLGNFGPEFGAWLKPVMTVLPSRARMCRIPSYVGEMIVVAKKEGSAGV